MKFRASYSTLNLWSSGNYQRAIEGYFKLRSFTTPAMQAGKEWHNIWESEVNTTGCMPKVFGGQKLIKPKTELKLVKQLDDWLELVGVIDLQHGENGENLVDYKTGKTTSDSYANSFQPRVYHILIPEATRFEFRHYDHSTKRTDTSIVHLTPTTLNKGIDWVVTYASEMHSHLLKNDLYKKYGRDK